MFFLSNVYVRCTEMGIYEEDECNAFYGTDQTVFPAFMNPDDGIGAYEPMICRTLVSTKIIIAVMFFVVTIFLFFETTNYVSSLPSYLFFSTWNTKGKKNIVDCLDCVSNWTWDHQLISKIAFVATKIIVHQKVPSIYFAAMVCMNFFFASVNFGENSQILQRVISFRNTVGRDTSAFLLGRRAVGECWIRFTSRIWKTCNLVSLWNCE